MVSHYLGDSAMDPNGNLCFTHRHINEGGTRMESDIYRRRRPGLRLEAKRGGPIPNQIGCRSRASGDPNRPMSCDLETRSQHGGARCALRSWAWSSRQ